jgi:hypothetical protein
MEEEEIWVSGLETKFNPVYEAQRYGLIQASRKIRDRR